MNLRYAAVLCFLLSSTYAFSTTISPYTNLGELTKASDAVYLAKAVDIETSDDDLSTSFYQVFSILKTIKGKHSEEVSVKYLSQVEGDLIKSIQGDVSYEQGQTYLIFLTRNGDGDYINVCVSYYIFEEVIKNDHSYLVPSGVHEEINVYSNGRTIEPLYTYTTDALVDELQKVALKKSTWDARKAKAKIDLHSEIGHKESKTIANHCNLFPVNPPPRWRNFETQQLPIYYQNNNSGCSNIFNELNTSVNHIRDNYKGVNVILEGAYSGYNPSCANGNAADGNFTSFVDNNLNGQRSIMVMFDDPCNQLGSLNSRCGGTLAVGGLYFATSQTHNYNGDLYSQAMYGYVIVNDGAGQCNCGVYSGNNDETNYVLLMTHELTHTIGFNHMSTNVSQANMSAYSCCTNSSVNNFDLQCVDYVYEPVDLPGCTNTAAENYNAQATSNNGSCTYCTNGVKDGDEKGVDCGGSGPNCPSCLADLTISNEGNLSISGSNIIVNNATVKNNGTANSPTSYLRFYLSTNSVITTNDILISTKTIQAISGGSQRSTSISVNVGNMKLAAGQYFVGMIADATSAVTESSEVNNTAYEVSPKFVVNSCNDGIRNAGETGVDCGGQYCSPCNCQSSVTYTNNINSNVTRHAQTYVRTNTTVKVGSNANVSFNAQSYIQLNPGFEVIKGASVLMNTENCN